MTIKELSQLYYLKREIEDCREKLEQSVYQIISKAKRLGYKCRYIVVDEEDET